MPVPQPEKGSCTARPHFDETLPTPVQAIAGVAGENYPEASRFSTAGKHEG